MPTDTPSTPLPSPAAERATLHPGAATLWASAFVIAALVVLQAGRLPGNPAYAGTASVGPNYVLLTADNGRGGDTQPDEVLYIIDNRTESLMIYELEGARIMLRDGLSLPATFRAAGGR